MTRLGQMIYDDGKIEGEDIKLIKQVCKKLDKGKSPDEIADDLEDELSTITRICEVASLYAPDYDYNLIYNQIKNQSL